MRNLDHQILRYWERERKREKEREREREQKREIEGGKKKKNEDLYGCFPTDISTKVEIRKSELLEMIVTIVKKQLWFM